MKFIKIILLLCMVNGLVNTYKILGIFPSMSKSHFLVGSVLMRGLAEAGHNVTVLSPYPQSEPILQNYRDICVQGIQEVIKSMKFVCRYTYL